MDANGGAAAIELGVAFAQSPVWSSGRKASAVCRRAPCHRGHSARLGLVGLPFGWRSTRQHRPETSPAADGDYWFPSARCLAARRARRVFGEVGTRDQSVGAVLVAEHVARRGSAATADNRTGPGTVSVSPQQRADGLCESRRESGRLVASSRSWKVVGELQRATDDAAADSTATISADGNRLTFVSDRSGNRDIWQKDFCKRQRNRRDPHTLRRVEAGIEPRGDNTCLQSSVRDRAVADPRRLRSAAWITGQSLRRLRRVERLFAGWTPAPLRPQACRRQRAKPNLAPGPCLGREDPPD